MRWCAQIAAVTFAAALIGLGCSGTSGDDGEANGDDTDNGPVDYSVMVGTCDVIDEASTPTCVEYWHVANGDAQMYAESTEALCGGIWTSDEPVCPTSGDYVGTCVSESSDNEVKTETYFYEPTDLAVARSSCEDVDGNTWVVE